MSKHITASLLASVVLVIASPAVAKDAKVDHSKMGHGAMQAPTTDGEATAIGVINSVDTQGGKVNVTHEPVKKLGWPTMTMDLAVTKRVDLSTVKPGSNVKFKLKLGRDKQYRITEIETK
jgi:Cu(I)/Ag(I) efflux system protein CusF